MRALALSRLSQVYAMLSGTLILLPQYGQVVVLTPALTILLLPQRSQTTMWYVATTDETDNRGADIGVPCPRPGT